MNFLDIMSANMIEEFPKCFFCKNPLSYFPIYVTPDNQNFCGRCILHNEKNVYVRNIAYETISQFLKFPCRYENEGCIEKVLPKEVHEHEKHCFHRIVNCPETVSTCDWKGPCYNLLEHCHNKHCEDILQDGEFEMDLLCCSEIVKFIECGKGLFVVILKYINKILQCAVCDFRNENMKCQLIISGEKSVSGEFYTTPMDNIKFMDLHFEASSLISGKINIGKSINDNKINCEMLSPLKCYICSEFALPPVYQCSKNHSTVCSNCTEQHISECDCWVQFGQAVRNISLDNIASLLNYPCKNHTNGCCFISKPDEMKIHQQHCRFEEFNCPVHEFIECAWKGLGEDLLTHLEKIHQDIIFSNFQKLSVDVILNHIYCYLIHYANHWFRLVFVRLDKIFCWTVQMVGRFTDNFRFEIEVLDENGNGRFLIGNSCSPVINRSQLFKDSNYYCYLYANQITRFMTSSSKLTFRVHIFS